MPASLQFTVSYPPNSIDNLTVSGNAAMAPDKTPTCISGSGYATCVLTAADNMFMGNGAVAVLQIQLSKTASGNVALAIPSALGASAMADPIGILGSGGSISVVSVPGAAPALTSFACAPALVPAGSQATCTITTSSAVSSDAGIYILTSSAALGVPILVNMPAGATTATFTVTVGPTSSAQPVTLTALLNGSVQRAALTVGAANPIPVISSLSPGTAVAGGGNFILAVSGSGFVSSSVVQWNSVNRATSFVNSNLLTATIGASDIAAAGAASVGVFTPLPGGGISGDLSFTISPSTPSAPSISQVQNGASFVPGPVAPGSFVAITGNNLADRQMQSDLTPLPTVLSSVSVSVNKIPASLKGIDPNQVNAQLPWNLLALGAADGTAEVVLTNSAGTSAPLKIQLALTAPGLFYALTDTSGVQRPAAVNGNDGSLPLPANIIYPGYASRPAAINDPGALILFATGLGAVTNQPGDGAPGLGVPPYSTTLQTPDVLVGGVPAQVVFCGLSPQFPGVYQLNVVLQPGTPAGDAVPVQIRLNGVTTSDSLKIAVSD